MVERYVSEMLYAYVGLSTAINISKHILKKKEKERNKDKAKTIVITYRFNTIQISIVSTR